MKILTFNIEKLDKKEVLRYLGYAGVNSIASIEELYLECEKIVLGCINPKAIYKIYPKVEGENFLDLTFTKTSSQDLRKNLQGCKNFALLVGTIGVELDRQILKYSKISPSKVVILQAMGAVAVETLCDNVCDKIKEEFGKTAPRFSCGYGDFPLDTQKDIFACLNVEKNLGVTLTNGNLMVPTKTVSAVVGIKGK